MMKTKVLNFPDDLQALIDLALLSSKNNFHIYDLPYRMSSWAVDSTENGQLWFCDDQLAAWAILQSPFWSLDYVIHPEYEDVLFPVILDWADHQVNLLSGTPYNRSSWYIQIFSDQLNRITALEQAGYQSQSNVGEDSWSKVLLRRSNQPLEKKYLSKPSFIVRPLAGEYEVPAYVHLHQTVFGSKNMRVDWRTRILQLPHYQSDLDIVVQAPDGTLAAFCIGWIMEDIQGNPQGQIEPLGCHPNFRQFALGRVALCEVIDRLIQMGVQSIWVETDNYRDTAFRLYQSLGFEVVKQVMVFKKDFNKL